MATYQGAGVNIFTSDRFKEMIKERVKRAWPGSEDNIGAFAGGGLIPAHDKIVKGSVDGVGTKAIIAALAGIFSHIGVDAVAMSAMDMYAAGAYPVYALDTLEVGRLVPDIHIRVIDSVISGCVIAGCRLIGGETAELPDLFKHPWMMNLNVAIIGFPSPELTFEQVAPYDAVYGWPSYGICSNGFSLVREVFGLREAPRIAQRRLAKYWNSLDGALGDALLRPTPIWIKEIEAQRKRGVKFAGHAHITGGGMQGNIPRILPANCKVIIDKSAWRRPAIFPLLLQAGEITDQEMDRVFNQGIIVVSIVSGGGVDMNDRAALKIGWVEGREGREPQVIFINKYHDQ